MRIWLMALGPAGLDSLVHDGSVADVRLGLGRENQISPWSKDPVKLGLACKYSGITIILHHALQL